MTEWGRAHRGCPYPILDLNAGYRRFTKNWWAAKWRWVASGWWRDLYTFYHRGRYGWAPRDTWSLDSHLNRVLGGSLAYLAEHHGGTPAGYPDGDFDGADHDRWTADLKRWATAFADAGRDDYYDLFKDDPTYDRWHAEEKRRSDARAQAMAEMASWWEALWD